MKDENPIDHMRFYMKDSPNKAVKVRRDQVSAVTTSVIRVSYHQGHQS